MGKELENQYRGCLSKNTVLNKLAIKYAIASKKLTNHLPLFDIYSQQTLALILNPYRKNPNNSPTSLPTFFFDLFPLFPLFPLYIGFGLKFQNGESEFFLATGD
jgi:hypothetical protein